MTREEKQKAIDALKISAPVMAVTQEEFNDYIQILNQVMDWLDQQPCDDWHDVPSDEMTLEQARQAVKDLRKKLVEYLEQQPCDDCVSREAVLETIEDCNSDGLKGIFCSYNDGKRFTEYIKALPSVTPKEKADAAKWLKDHGISLD